MNAPPPAGQGLAQRLGKAHVGLRPELQFSRHVFRGKISYIVRDPVTFDSHRVSAEDYELLVSIRPERCLADTFKELVAADHLDEEHEEDFYEFVVSLHSLGFLSLGISDSSRLYRRYVTKQRAKRRSKILGIMFLQIPLFNPDAFLTRTVEACKFLFSRWFFAVWCLLVAAGGAIVALRWEDFSAQFADIFATQNILILWVTLIGLKVFHELGHAYATKAFGGQVPEMGAYMIAFTPCAYVDASSSWGFSRKRYRIIVGMAGMYVELIFAAAAALIWSVTSPGWINSVAHNIVMLASVVTIGFNVNPLMRFDGYYALSDWLEIPNLRSRGSQAISAAMKKLTLGIEHESDEEPRSTRLFLCFFGVAGAVYRVFVVMSISALIATKFFLIGIVLGGVYIGAEIFKSLRKTLAFLWWDPETSHVRLRAVGLSVVLLGTIAAVLFLSPMSAHVHADGIVGFADQQIVRVQEPGFLRSIHVEHGQPVEVGEAVAQLWDSEPHALLAQAKGKAERARIEADSFEYEEPALAAKARETHEMQQQSVEFNQARVDRLRPLAGIEGTVMRCIGHERLGSYLKEGEEIALIGSGAHVVTLFLTPDEFRSADPSVGDLAEFRTAAATDAVLRGKVIRVEPMADPHVKEIALTQHGGGDIVVDANTQNSTSNYFQVVIELTAGDTASVRHGMKGAVRLDATPEPLGLTLFRKLVLFLKRLDAA